MVAVLVALVCVMKRRVAIARRNLVLSFPEMPEVDREAMIKHNFESVGMGAD
ncbi:hypothetical protein WDV93_16950 [Pantoea ananatis]